MKGWKLGRSGSNSDHLGCFGRSWVCAAIAGLSILGGGFGCETPGANGDSEGPASASPSPAPGLPERAVLISIEGLSADDYQWLPAGGLQDPELSHMPNLVKLATQGVFADDVVPVAPATVYPTHASLASGRHPNRHGVVADFLIGEHGIQPTPYWRSYRLKGDTLWRAAKRANKVVAALAWPSTIGAEIEWLVPDRPPLRHGETWVGVLQTETSPLLWQRLIELTPQDVPPGWPSAEARDALLGQLACEMATDSSTPDLMLLRWSQVAATQAIAGPGSRAALEALRRVDEELRRLLECFRAGGIRESTAFFVVGDRNLQPVHSLVRPNVVLADSGLLSPPKLGAPGQVRSWSAISRSNGRSAFVYARDESSAVLARRALRNEAERSGRFRVIPATELQKLHIDPQVWFGLEAEPGVWFQDDSKGKVEEVSPLVGAAGALSGSAGRPVGLVAAGPGLRRGLRIPKMEQVDIAPTLAQLLQIPLEDADGRPMLGMLLPALPPSLPEASRRPAQGAGQDDAAD